MPFSLKECCQLSSYQQHQNVEQEYHLDQVVRYEEQQSEVVEGVGWEGPQDAAVLSVPPWGKDESHLVVAAHQAHAHNVVAGH